MLLLTRRRQPWLLRDGNIPNLKYLSMGGFAHYGGWRGLTRGKLDTALRRRFGFVELMPDSSTLGGAIAGETILGQWLDALNLRIREHICKDARNLQIGHAYLMDDNGKPVTDFAKFSRIIAEDIIPLLEEYCCEDYGKLVEILGGDMVDGNRQHVREEIFLPARREDLIQALRVPTPEMDARSWSPSILGMLMSLNTRSIFLLPSTASAS